MREIKLIRAVLLLLCTASIFVANGAGTGAEVGRTCDLSAQFVFQTNQSQVVENSRRWAIFVSRVGNIDGIAVVDVYASDVTAINGVDYSFSPQTLSFADQETNKVVFVEIIDDQLVQSDRTFALHLTNSIGASIDEPSSAFVTILENDFVYPELFLDDVEVVESAGVAHLQFRLSYACLATPWFEYATVDGSAVSGVRGNYLAANGTIVFNWGETNKTISVPIMDNNLAEHDRVFYIVLRDPHICTLARTNWTKVTIIDDDRMLKMETSVTRNGCRLLWRTNSAYELQSSLNLINWSPVPLPSNVLGPYFCLSNSMFEPQQFYRLKPR